MPRKPKEGSPKDRSTKKPPKRRATKQQTKKPKTSKPKKGPRKDLPLADLLAFHTLVTTAREKNIPAWEHLGNEFTDELQTALLPEQTGKAGAPHELNDRLLRDYAPSGQAARTPSDVIGKPLALTGFGERLFEMARAVTVAYTSHIARVRDDGPLRIAISDSAVHYLLPTVWRELERVRAKVRGSNLNVQLLRYDPPRVRDQLSRGDIDVAIAWQVLLAGKPVAPDRHAGLCEQALTSEIQLAVLYHLAHAVWGADAPKELELTELKGQRLYGSFTLDGIGDLAHEAHVAELIEVSGTAAAVPFVRLNSGVALFPSLPMMVRAVLASEPLRAARLNCSYKLQLKAFWRGGAENGPSPPVREVIDTFRSALSLGEGAEKSRVLEEWPEQVGTKKLYVYRLPAHPPATRTAQCKTQGTVQLALSPLRQGVGAVRGNYCVSAVKTKGKDKRNGVHEAKLSGQYSSNELALVWASGTQMSHTQVPDLVSARLRLWRIEQIRPQLLIGQVVSSTAGHAGRLAHGFLVLSEEELDAIDIARLGDVLPILNSVRY